MCNAIQSQFNASFDSFIDRLVNTSFSGCFKCARIPESVMNKIGENLAEEALSGIVAYDFRATLFNAVTFLGIAETALAVAAFAAGFFATGAALVVSAVGSVILRELIDQNIRKTLTGYFEDWKEHPFLFRKLIL